MSKLIVLKHETFNLFAVVFNKVSRLNRVYIPSKENSEKFFFHSIGYRFLFTNHVQNDQLNLEIGSSKVFRLSESGQRISISVLEEVFDVLKFFISIKRDLRVCE